MSELNGSVPDYMGKQEVDLGDEPLPVQKKEDWEQTYENQQMVNIIKKLNFIIDLLQKEQQKGQKPSQITSSSRQKTCPKCGGVLVKKWVKSQRKHILACPNWPKKCEGHIVNLEG